MRIVLFVVDDLEFVPKLIDPLITRFGNQIVATYVSDSFFDRTFFRKRKWFLIRNLYPFCIRIDDWFRFAIKTRRIRKKGYEGCKNMVEYLSKKGFRSEFIEEIRTHKTRRMLRQLKPDIFLFCPFSKIAGPKFIKIPKIGAFNVHLGKLPEYRGALSSFWVLRFGDEMAGATFHRVVPEIDAGEIITEVRLPVQTKSMEKLMHSTVCKASQMVVDGMEKIISDDFSPVETGGRPTNYFLMPTYRDFSAFYKYGCRLI